ncbi:Glycosyl transferase family 2 [Candidatus Methylobacter favarea]|uniref:Glycosyl transferase family 2 n=1 Tax=Candidatus Methylobacter favarea TaxID=2707345 RepID=A0A8S0WLU0_9GAMM|nr:glycosyltransferase family 2 protein [Candidatus Methylobacter favarea]CAA9892860.1 Glycosyl transferase family 2 [Candidatus Methylobacter favarea]
MQARITVLIPSCNRPTALAVTLTGLCFQQCMDFTVIIADQSDTPVYQDASVRTVIRLLEKKGRPVQQLTNLPQRGLAQQRQFLLDCVASPYCLYLDDDVLLEPFVIENMRRALEEEKIGFVGQALIGLSYSKDYRPQEQAIEFWEGAVEPELVTPKDPSWRRHSLHNAANILHVQEKLQLSPQRQRKYKVAWVGGCVLYAAEKLRAAGGFNFWQELPSEHVGEDVFAQLNVMKRYGGCGLIPSGAYHLEAPTTIPNRQFDIPKERNP